MSGISLDTTVRRKTYVKDFCVATPEEFVKCFGGSVTINKVRWHYFAMLYKAWEMGGWVVSILVFHA